jgi:hypothetical protein
MPTNKQRQDEDGEVFGPGTPLEKLKDDPMLLELALVRVRRRHEPAGHKLSFGDLLREASKEADADYERSLRGEDFTSRYSLRKKPPKKEKGRNGKKS